MKLVYILWMGTILMSCNQNQKRDPIKDDKIVNPVNLEILIRTDRRSFVKSITENLSSDYEKTLAINNWLAKKFEWKATDYTSRSVQQIIERGGGNCNDLARVVISLLDTAQIKRRKIKEINIHEFSEERQANAEERIKINGYASSVFGQMHNDHIWIEIYDQNSKEWIPADPSLGLVGINNWINGRLRFGTRKTLDPESKNMIVPIGIFAKDERDKYTINRTQHYLISGFDAFYDHQLSKLPSWNRWKMLIDKIDDKCLLAFEGKENFHQYHEDLVLILKTFKDLKIELLNNSDN